MYAFITPERFEHGITRPEQFELRDGDRGDVTAFMTVGTYDALIERATQGRAALVAKQAGQQKDVA